MSKILRRARKGFTLIELMIVVAIIGILAAIAIPNFLRFQLKAKSSEGKVNIAAIRTAEESYLAEFGNYVAGTPSPAAAPSGTAKATFSDQGGFDTLGWSPEGEVFFNYAVQVSGAAYTIDASADIDGDNTLQHWGYVHPDGAGVSTGGTLGTCADTGVGAGENQLNTVGPCGPGMGQSIF